MSHAPSSSKRSKPSASEGDDPWSLKVLVFDATEPSEPGEYVVDVRADALARGDEVVRKLARRLRRNLVENGKDVYEHVAVGGEDAGLVSQNSEDPEGELDEIITYLQTTSSVKFKPALHCREGAIQVMISLASV